MPISISTCFLQHSPTTPALTIPQSFPTGASSQTDPNQTGPMAEGCWLWTKIHLGEEEVVVKTMMDLGKLDLQISRQD